MRSTKKRIYEEIYNDIIKFGWTVLTPKNEYLNTKQKLKLLSPCNHINYKSYNSFMKNQSCSDCSKLKPYTINKVRDLFNKNNMICLDSVYINSQTLMNYKCKVCNYIGMKKVNKLQQGRGCPKCAGLLKHTFEYIQNLFNEHNLILLDNIYINNKTPLTYQCMECNYIGKITSNDVIQNHGCWLCSINKRSGENNYNWSNNREYIKLNRIIHNYSVKYKRQIRKIINNYNINYNYLNMSFNWSKNSIVIFKEKYKQWKNKEFHVDHIIPIKAFVNNNFVTLDNINNYTLNIINSLDNIQILKPFKNKSKNGKYLQEDYDNYIEQFKDR